MQKNSPATPPTLLWRQWCFSRGKGPFSSLTRSRQEEISVSPPPQHPEKDIPARHQHGPQFICKQQITSADKLQTAIYCCIRITCIYVCVHIYTYICIQKYIHFFFFFLRRKRQSWIRRLEKNHAFQLYVTGIFYDWFQLSNGGGRDGYILHLTVKIPI